MNGKGSKQRPRQISRDEYEERWGKIFHKCHSCGDTGEIKTHDGVETVYEECECVDYLDSEEFYNLMQDYRHTPIQDQYGIVKAFEAVKNGIRKNL